MGWSPLNKLPARGGTQVVETSPSGDEVLLRDEPSGTSHVLQRPVTEVRAAGFSPSGDILVIATASDVEIFRRAGSQAVEADGPLARPAA